MSQSVAIIGAGMMGTGLARHFAGAGWQVAVAEPMQAARARLAAAVPEALAVEAPEEAMQGAVLVIEAAPEQIGLKQDVFAELFRGAPADAVLATNSSVIPVGAITAKLSTAEAARVAGAHFWNPPDIIPLVEVIAGPRTAEATAARLFDLLALSGKEPVRVRADTVPGNRLQHALWREAMALVDEGVCTPEEVDHIVKRSFGLRLPVLGPLENADLVGLELTEAIHRVVFPTLSRATAPAACVMQLLARGETGAASGRGLYDHWDEAGIAALRHRLSAHLRRMLE